MKNILLAINILLLVLVGYLYYLHFSQSKSNHNQSPSSSSTEYKNEKSKVAYIDLDSLQNNYGYYQKLKKAFEQKQASANDQITALQKNIKAARCSYNRKPRP
jgi:outer membrane protein